MSGSRIYVLNGKGGELLPMEEQAYDAESLLQESLAALPDLLPGWQIDPDDPRRWLLVRREAGVPCQPDSGDFWSLDHVFLDQDAVPTLVECKRSSDRRLRREVMGQMLDYAANATAYWPKGKLRSLATETAGAGKASVEEALRRLLQLPELPTDEEQDAFWETADANVAQGRIRLLFVSDAIPKEMRRVIEFLNAKMDDVEILGVEIKQFVGKNSALRAFVPSVIGQNERALAGKSTAKRKHESMESLLAAYPNKAAFEAVVACAKEHGHRVEPGITNFSVKCALDDKWLTYAFGKPAGPFLQFTTEYMGSLPDLKKRLETALEQLGHVMTGKNAYNVPVGETGEAALRALPAVIGEIRQYSAASASA
jgi:hypothetical protein